MKLIIRTIYLVICILNFIIDYYEFSNEFSNVTRGLRPPPHIKSNPRSWDMRKETTKSLIDRIFPHNPKTP
jgi:hypothetical protein